MKWILSCFGTVICVIIFSLGLVRRPSLTLALLGLAVLGGIVGAILQTRKK